MVHTKTWSSHGESRKRLYTAWASMKNRCYCKNNNSHKIYGDRGITVCDEWRSSYQSFRDWAMSNGYDDALYLDRIDNDKGYTPENCRWVSQFTSGSNTRTRKYIPAFGEKKFISDWLRDTRCEVGWSTLQARVSRGIPVERAIKKKQCKRKPNGENSSWYSNAST